MVIISQTEDQYIKFKLFDSSENTIVYNPFITTELDYISGIRLESPVKSIEENHHVQSLKSALCRRTSVIWVLDRINEISPKPCSCKAICYRKIASK